MTQLSAFDDQKPLTFEDFILHSKPANSSCKYKGTTKWTGCLSATN
jgi:hypothetical protein